MSQYVDRAKALFDKATEVHREMYGELSALREEARTRPMTQADRVDIGFMCKRISVMMNQVRKTADHCEEILSMILCLTWIKQATNDVDASSSIKGQFATGLPDVKQAANIPSAKSSPEAYAAFLDSMGVKPEVIAFGVLRPHWPTLQEYLTELMREGKPLPPGVKQDDTYPVYKVTHRLNAGLDSGTLERAK